MFLENDSAVRLSVIAAVARNGVIGCSGGGMPWRLPTDLKNFRKLTEGKPVVMGQRTFLEIGRPLPGRTNLVLSRDPLLTLDGARVVHSIDEAISVGHEVAHHLRCQEIMVIGGGEVYAQLLPHARCLYLTEIEADTPGDIFFPAFDPLSWRRVGTQHAPNNSLDSHRFSFSVFEK